MAEGMLAELYARELVRSWTTLSNCPRLVHYLNLDLSYPSWANSDQSLKVRLVLAD